MPAYGSAANARSIMFRALWRKEWRQLRLLRWSGVGIALLLPPILLSVAEAARRGWTVLGQVSSYTTANVVQELVPMFMALAVWPLLALMTAAHAFAADRGNGTDQFLLQRPVRRSGVWWVRGAAALVSALTIVLGQCVIWLVWMLPFGQPATLDLGGMIDLLLVGLIVVTVALLAGTVAAAFVRTPMQAVLLGLLFTAIPLGLGQLLGSLYLGFSIERIPLGFGLPLILLAGYVVAAIRMDCRGEPAGRGRLRRGLSVLAVALVGMPIAAPGVGTDGDALGREAGSGEHVSASRA